MDAFPRRRLRAATDARDQTEMYAAMAKSRGAKAAPGSRLKAEVEQALSTLATKVGAVATTCSTHTLLLATGVGRDATVVRSVAVYLTGAIAGCLEMNMQIRLALFDDKTLSNELFDGVVAVIGPDNAIDHDRKVTERNPWMWEGLSHLLLHLWRASADKHPPGEIIAKTLIHLDAKDHGLDVVALYRGPMQLGVTAGECKAYLGRPAAAIRDAANTLGELDTDRRDNEVRAAIITMAGVLSPEDRKNLVGTFWKRERAYLPLVCCDSGSAIDWATDRPTLGALARPVDRKFLIPVCIDGAEQFFDEVADAMRSFSRSLA